MIQGNRFRILCIIILEIWIFISDNMKNIFAIMEKHFRYRAKAFPLSWESNSDIMENHFRYHAFIPPSIDAHRTLGSPSTHRHPPSSWLSLRESWREAPERAHCTDSTYKLPTEPPHRFLIRNCIPPRTVCTTPLPLPSGGTSPHGARQELCANFKLFHKPKFIEQTEGLAQAKAPLCKGSCQRS